jgi:Heterokaryon incompatibility protein (HET)
MCGESEHREGILVNGKRHYVLPNLFTFLNKARELGITDWLWIDAISIHQTDLQERNQQVRQMANIYRQARHTLVWLGELHHSDSTIIGKAFESFYSPRWKHFPLIRRAFLPRWNRMYRAVGDLGYFDRVWIIQELVVSKTVLIILWNEFVAEQTFRDFAHGMFWESGGLWDSTMVNALELLKIRHGTSNSLRCSLTTMLYLASASRCSEPRDRLFGLLGLVSDGEAFPVDYAKPLAELQLDAVEYFLPKRLDDSSRLDEALNLVRLLSLAFETECTWLCKQCSLRARAVSADRATVLSPHHEHITTGQMLAQASPVRTFTAHVSDDAEGLDSSSHLYWDGVSCRKCRETLITLDQKYESKIVKLERPSPTEMQLTVAYDAEAAERQDRALQQTLIWERYTGQSKWRRAMLRIQNRRPDAPELE